MKPITFFFAFALALGLSACTQQAGNYLCTCTWDDGAGNIDTSYTQYNDMTEDQAEVACDRSSGTNGGITKACTLSD